MPAPTVFVTGVPTTVVPSAAIRRADTVYPFTFAAPVFAGAVQFATAVNAPPAGPLCGSEDPRCPGNSRNHGVGGRGQGAGAHDVHRLDPEGVRRAVGSGSSPGQVRQGAACGRDDVRRR